MAKDWMNQWEDERDNFESELLTFRNKPILQTDLSSFTIHEIKLAMNRLQDEITRRLRSNPRPTP